jgi:hypothetical protein
MAAQIRRWGNAHLRKQHSYLKFDHPVRGFRQNRKFWQFTTHHGYLITGMKSGANVAVFVNLVRQILALGGCETHASKEFWSAREQAGASDAVFLGLCQQRFH